MPSPKSETHKHETDYGVNAASDSQRSTPKEEFSNPRSERVDEPDSTSQQGTEMPFHCEICGDDFDWETLKILETHRRCDHDVRREELDTLVRDGIDIVQLETETPMVGDMHAHNSESRYRPDEQKKVACNFCGWVFESTLAWGEHSFRVHIKEITRGNKRRWDRERRSRKRASQSHTAAHQSPKHNIELDAVETDQVSEPPTNKPSVLNGLQNLTVDDLARLELSDLAYIRYCYVPYARNDRDIVPMKEITALKASHVSYGSVIKTGTFAGSPYAREVILCRTCGSRMIKDGTLRDICLRGCPPSYASRTNIVGPYGMEIFRFTNPDYLPIL